MADITRDSFQATKFYKQVIFQRGKDLPDFDLNEMQQIEMFEKYLFDGVTEGVPSHGFQVLGTGAAQDATVTSGAFYVQGLAYGLFSNTALSTLIGANPLPTNGGADRYDYVYADFQLDEIDATEDPNIAVSALGETARRKQLKATWAVNTGSYPGAAPGAGNLYANGVVRVVVAQVFRPTGVAAVAAADVLNLTTTHLARAAQMDAQAVFELTQDATVTWDSNLGQLSIRNESDTSDLTEGLIMRWPGGAEYVISGQWNISAGQGLFFEPKRYGNRDWAAGTRITVGGGTVLTDTQIGLSAASLDTNSNKKFLIAAHLETGVLALARGRVIRNTTAWTAGTRKQTFGSWTGPDSRSTREVTLTVGDGSKSFGDVNTISAALALLPVLAGATEKTRVTLLLKSGEFSETALGAPASNRLYYQCTTGNMHVVIQGMGQQETKITANRTNVTTGWFWLYGSGAAHFRVTFKDLSIYGTSVASADVPDLEIDYADVEMENVGIHAANVKINHASLYGTVKLKDCYVVPDNTANYDVHGFLITGISNGANIGDVFIQDCEFASTASSTGFHGLYIEECTRTRILHCAFLNTTDNTNSACIYVANNANGFNRYVTIDGCTFDSTNTGGMPINITGGVHTRVNNNVIKSSSGWYGGAMIQYSVSLNGSSHPSTELWECCNNDIDVASHTADWYGVITTVTGSTGGVTTLRNARVNCNKIRSRSGVSTANAYVAITFSEGTGDSVFEYVQARGNDIEMYDSHTGSFIGIELNNVNTTFAAGTADLAGARLTENTIVAAGSGGAAAAVVAGIWVNGPSRSSVVANNVIRLKSTGLGGGGARTDCVRLGTNSVNTLISDNYFKAEYPVDCAGATVGAYVTGNHVRDCANTGGRGGTGADSTFAVADNKIA